MIFPPFSIRSSPAISGKNTGWRVNRFHDAGFPLSGRKANCRILCSCRPFFPEIRGRAEGAALPRSEHSFPFLCRFSLFCGVIFPFYRCFSVIKDLSVGIVRFHTPARFRVRRRASRPSTAPSPFTSAASQSTVTSWPDRYRVRRRASRPFTAPSAFTSPGCGRG